MAGAFQGQPGKILGLLDLSWEHWEAIEADLFTATGYTLDDVPGRVNWRVLVGFVTHRSAESAFERVMQRHHDQAEAQTPENLSKHVGTAPIPAADFERWWNATDEEREHWEEAA